MVLFRFTRSALAVLVLFFMAGPGLAQLNLSDTLPVDPKIRIGKLDNGLTYYIRQNKKPEQKVELRLAINAGSILEDDDQQGLAHMAEHMAFNCLYFTYPPGQTRQPGQRISNFGRLGSPGKLYGGRYQRGAECDTGRKQGG